MFEHFLTDLLKIVVVLDVLGVIAYFLLGALKPKPGIEPGDLVHPEPIPSSPIAPSPASSRAGRFGQLRIWLATSASRLLPGRRESHAAASAASLDAAFVRLNRVLHSYRDGLA